MSVTRGTLSKRKEVKVCFWGDQVCMPWNGLTWTWGKLVESHKQRKEVVPTWPRRCCQIWLGTHGFFNHHSDFRNQKKSAKQKICMSKYKSPFPSCDNKRRQAEWRSQRLNCHNQPTKRLTKNGLGSGMGTTRSTSWRAPRRDQNWCCLQTVQMHKYRGKWAATLQLWINLSGTLQ